MKRARGGVLTFSSRNSESEVENPATHMSLLETSRSRTRPGLRSGYSLCCRHTTAEETRAAKGSQDMPSDITHR